MKWKKPALGRLFFSLNYRLKEKKNIFEFLSSLIFYFD